MTNALKELDLSKDLEAILRRNRAAYAPILPDHFTRNDVATIDLSVNNKELAKLDLFDTAGLERYIERLLQERNARVGVGGYNEKRGWYARSEAFNLDGEPREFHMGIDIWVPTGTAIHSPLEGSIHSFNNNAAFGDFGPTIIIQNELDGVVFYTLFGHLSVESLAGLEKGQRIKKGQQIGTVGDSTVNGCWPPHLHLQIIGDMQGREGDFYAVINRSRHDEFLKLCPDPNLIFNLA